MSVEDEGWSLLLTIESIDSEKEITVYSTKETGTLSIRADDEDGGAEVFLDAESEGVLRRLLNKRLRDNQ